MGTNYRPCYVQVVRDLVNGVDINKTEYPEFAERKHSPVEELAWKLYAEMAVEINKVKGHPNHKKEYARLMIEFIKNPCPAKYKLLVDIAVKLDIEHPAQAMTETMYQAAQFTLPEYHLTNKEYDTILAAEEYGRGKPGVLLDYCGKFGHKKVLSIDYRTVPANKDGRIDVVLVYSGHQQTGHKAAELMYNYLLNHSKFPDYVFNIGFEDNQNMTDFNPAFKYRKRSEADTYANEEIALGLPENYVRKLWLDPTDTDTWQNIKVVASLKRRFGIEKCNLIIVGYPVYQLRTATEFAWGLDHAEDAPDCNIIIADIPPKRRGMASMKEASGRDFDEYRVLSYDQPLYQLADLSLANCCAHIHLRTSGDDQIRYAIPGLGEYPDSFKELAVMFMAYSYPNVTRELCGDDEEVAGAMKILRYLQLCEYDKGMSGEAMDRQEDWYIKQTVSKLQREGLTGKAIIDDTRYMDKQEAEEAILAYQDLRRE